MERRTEPRINVELLGKLEINGEVWDCYIQNLSSGGAFILSNFPAQISSQIILQFEHEELKFIKKAEVVNSKELEESRKKIFQIAKNLRLNYSINLKFTERISNDFYEKLKSSL